MSEEIFDAKNLLADGYAERFPNEPAVIDMRLESATCLDNQIELRPGLRLEMLGKRASGLIAYLDNKLIHSVGGLSPEDQKLILNFLDNPALSNDLIPNLDE